MNHPKKGKKDLSEFPAYRKLVEDLKKIFGEATAQGVDLFKRDDILTCRSCGAYEDILADGIRVICDASGKVLRRDEEFILIDRKERCTHQKNLTYCKMTYEFICSLCGAQQNEIVRDRFEN